MKQKWIPKKANASQVTRARKAKALRALRRGKQALDVDASRRADEALEAARRELDQTTQPPSGKRQ